MSANNGNGTNRYRRSNMGPEHYSVPVLTDREREERREAKRQQAEATKEELMRGGVLALGAVCAAILVWQLTLPRPSFVVIITAIVFATPAVAAILPLDRWFR